MKNIKEIYNIIADTIIALLLSLIGIVALYAIVSTFSEVGAKGLTYIQNLYFYFLTERVVFSLILVIVVTIFITPRLSRKLLNE